MPFLFTFRENVLPIVQYLLAALFLLFLIILTWYLLITYLYSRNKRYLARKKPAWENMISRLLEGTKAPDEVYLSLRERKYFREVLIAVSSELGADGQDKLRELYKRLGFLNQDFQKLKSRLWWRRVHALERLEELEIVGSEVVVFPLLHDRVDEVRFAALKMLASIGSRKLGQVLPGIFGDNNRWSYRFLVNVLFSADIPVDNLKLLARSPDRDLRKAAAILLGKPGREGALPLLKNLINDKIKDVRREAVCALGRLATPSAMPLLQQKINDPHPQVRTATAKSLGQLKDRNTLSLLEQLAGDADFYVRYQAFSALIKSGDPGKDIIRKYEVKYPAMTKEFLAGSKR